MWLYHLIRSTREAFPYMLMALLIFEAILAFGLMFVFPPGSLGLVFIGLLTLLCSGLIRSLLLASERMVGRLVGIQAKPLDPDGDRAAAS